MKQPRRRLADIPAGSGGKTVGRIIDIRTAPFLSRNDSSGFSHTLGNLRRPSPARTRPMTF